MHEEALQSYCPAFGLLPDLAVFAMHPPFGYIAVPPAQHWAWELPPAGVDAAHEPEFVFSILRRIQSEIDHPVVVSHDRMGRRVLKVLGCYLFLEQKNQCWRVFEWKYDSLGLPTLTKVPAQNVVVQSPPWRWQWLRALARPIALEYADWRWRRGHETDLAAAGRYGQWLVASLESKLQVQGLRAELGRYLALDPWALKLASRFLRPHDQPHKALLADYNCVMAKRSAFAKLESDAPHLIPLYGALCRARRFPRIGEPVHRLKCHLMANGITPRAWIAIVNASPRQWLVVSRYYTSASADQVLDLIQCIDRLGFDWAPPTWLLDTLLAPHGGPGFRYSSYAVEISRRVPVWRHIVRLLQHVQKPTETQCLDLKRVVDWVGQTGQDELTRAQRQAGWRWLVVQSLRWEEQQAIELQLCGTSWWVPVKDIWVGEFQFRFLTTPLEVWEEGRAMRHCAYDLVRGCERSVCWLVSITRKGVRMATLELRRTDDKWLIHQLAGKANGSCTAAVWSASSFLCSNL